MMLENILFALLLTFVVGFLFETVKIKIAFDQIQKINGRIENKISNMLKKTNEVSVFIVNDLRKMINEEFVKTKIIDDYELYKIDDRKIHMKYSKQKAEQEIEILLIGEHFDMREIALRYDDLDEF